jgi:RND family efflux transporter MFP subunit
MPDSPPTPVAVHPVERGTISSTYAATATLEAYQEAEVLARVSGVVVKLEAEEGDRVREGSTLLRIDDREFRLRLQQAEAEAAKQKTRFERMQKMFEGNLVSAEEFETAKNDLASADANHGLAELELSYTRVAAPMSGTVVRRLVDSGQSVNNGTVLFGMADLDRLLARVHVPAKEFRNISTDQPVDLVLDATGERFTGRIRLVSPVVDAQSGTVKVTVEVPRHPASVRPGDFAAVQIVTAQHEGALLVPRAAVLADRGDQIVYVAADSVAERRVVTVGFQDDERAEVLSGIREGDQVVIQGQRSLKQGARIRVLAAVADSSRGAS